MFIKVSAFESCETEPPFRPACRNWPLGNEFQIGRKELPI